MDSCIHCFGWNQNDQKGWMGFNTFYLRHLPTPSFLEWRSSVRGAVAPSCSMSSEPSLSAASSHSTPDATLWMFSTGEYNSWRCNKTFMFTQGNTQPTCITLKFLQLSSIGYSTCRPICSTLIMNVLFRTWLYCLKQQMRHQENDRQQLVLPWLGVNNPWENQCYLWLHLNQMINPKSRRI